MKNASFVDSLKKKLGNSTKDRWSMIALVLIVLFGFILRMYALGGPSLWLDESISSLAAEKISERGVPVFDSGLFYSRALIFHYLLAPLVGIFNNDFGVRLISVVFGLGTIVLVYYIGRTYNRTAGLVASLFTALLYLEVAYSRQARFYQMFQFFFFLTLFLLYKSKDSKKYAWLSGISFIILVDTHLAGLILAPLIFNLFLKEGKDWKLIIIPVVAVLYFLPSILDIALGSSELLVYYAGNYSSALLFYLGAFASVSLFGLPFAFKWNKRLTLLLVLPSLTLIIAVLFLKIFALRYVYFIVLLAPIFLGVLFSYIYKNSKILFIIALIFVIVYPSNLFSPYHSLTIIKPEPIQLNTLSEPILDYKSLSPKAISTIKNSQSVVLTTPSFAWYFENPDYFIPFTYNGLDSGYALHNGVDSYTGAERFDLINPQISKFVLVEDSFGYVKLTEKRRGQLETMKEECDILDDTNFVKVYWCDMSR